MNLQANPLRPAPKGERATHRELVREAMRCTSLAELEAMGRRDMSEIYSCRRRLDTLQEILDDLLSTGMV